MKEIKTPFISPELISYLDKIFPEKSPQIHESDREIWMYVGKVFVVKFLKNKLKEQEQSNNILKGGI